MEEMIARREHHGHDWAAPNIDGLGIFYITFAIFHTLFIITGLGALFVFRNTHSVRIRSLPTIFGSVLCLHIYLVQILLVYPINGFFKCGWEFWNMSIIFPFGIALFQAGNIRLYSYAKEQKDVAEGNFFGSSKYGWSWSNPRPIRWIRRANVEKRTYVAIGAGMTVQMVISIILFFGSRKFHKSYGVFEEHVNASMCRRGGEWIPSVSWQFLWSFVLGPFVLLRIKDIKDTHYWAWQTRLVVIAGLPGTPLWLIFVYASSDTLYKVNLWFPPAGWFLPGLLAMQLASIFFPLLDIYKSKKLEKRYGSNRDGHYGENVESDRPRNPYSMATLELQLAKNPSNLLYWAYTKEFTAENIMFLTSVRDFKRKWQQVAKHSKILTALQLRDRYEEAALIYFKLVNPQTARMNINIDYRTFNDLQDIFKDCHYEAFLDDSSSCSKGSSCYTENIVTPWADNEPESQRPISSTSKLSDEKMASDSEVDKLYPLPVTEILAKNEKMSDVRIPSKFSLEIFDRAYEAVKNDVYLNTWVRYEARYSRPHASSPTGRPRSMSFVGRV